MAPNTHLDTSKAIQRRTGRTFHLATRFLPERVRHPTYVLYAFFRVADEIVDDTDPPSPTEQRRQLEQLRDEALGQRPATSPVLTAFQDLRESHDIPDTEVNVFVDAMLADIDHDGYADHAELATYLRGSSVAVANMMLSVMDPEELEAAAPHAASLAEAFQLTNFLRDVKEDIEDYDRVYLPRDRLHAHGVDRQALTRGEATTGFQAALAAELARTEELYRDGVAGIKHLPIDCQFPILLAAVLYAEHHRLIRSQDFDVLTNRPELTVVDYLRVITRTGWHWWRTRDPVRTFEAASVLPQVTDPEVETDPGDSADRWAMIGRLRARWPMNSGD